MYLTPIIRIAALVTLAGAVCGACVLVPAARTSPVPTDPAGAVSAPPAAGPSAHVPAASPTETGRPVQHGSIATPSAPVGAGTDSPPQGLLRSGGNVLAGRLGSYCYRDGCADIGAWPPRPDLPLLAETSNSLSFELGNREAFAAWSASYGPRSNGPPSGTLGQGGENFDPDANTTPATRFREITFPRPPAGDWVVWVRLTLENGDLEYAWNVPVLPDTGR